jgi:peroxiredoxin
MKKFLLQIVLIFLITYNVFSQENKYKQFEIHGTINVDSGTITLAKIFPYNNYPQDIEDYTATIKGNSFYISGKIPYPLAFRLISENYFSDFFVVDPGTQKIICDINKSREIPDVYNTSMTAFKDEEIEKRRKELLDARNKNRSKWDSLNQIYKNAIPDEVKMDWETENKTLNAKGDSLYFLRASKYPDSYNSFWRFINMFNLVGYEPIYEDIFELYSDSLKNTYSGRALEKDLKTASKLAAGNTFPSIPLEDNNGQTQNALEIEGNSFTLVDFWYSGCRPCITQFPDFIELYNKFNDRGFGIVGISTDKNEHYEKWRAAIEKYGLIWQHYWDKDGIESKKLLINRFPTNYLLDKDGNIVAKDITPVELKYYLTECLD